MSKPAPEYRNAHNDAYQRLLTDYEKLRARIAAYKAIDHVLNAKKDGKPRNLLEEVALTMIRAAEASDPRVGHYNEPDRIKRSIDAYPMPGALVASARKAERAFHTALDMAIATYDDKRSRNFGPNEVNPPAPRVRCGNRECAMYDERVPAWNHKGRAMEFCGGCGRRLPKPKEFAA